MKQLKKCVVSLVLAVVVIFSLIPTAHAADYTYPVEGGNLTFDPTTGTIKKCGHLVYSADIPSDIYDVPVVAIGDNAFKECKRLSSVTIPDSVTSIGSAAFGLCPSLQTITIPNGVTSLGSNLFSGCSSLTDVIIPGSVEKLPNYLFKNCTALKNVTLEDGIVSVGSNVFSHCDSLQTVLLPDSVTELALNAFVSCKELKTVTVGKGIKFVNFSAFNNCKKLESIYFRGDAPGTDGRGKVITDFAPGFKIYYPEGASGWTSPTWNGYITESYVPAEDKQQEQKPTEPVVQAPPAPSNLATATPTASSIYVNGTAVEFDAYNVGGNNYFKLRDLAFILSGSEAQFNVVWDNKANTISLLSGQAYTPVGGEMSGKGAINKIAKPTTSSVLVNGSSASFTAYNIDGNNYFKLRDIGQAFNFSVAWDDVRKSISIDADSPYTE